MLVAEFLRIVSYSRSGVADRQLQVDAPLSPRNISLGSRASGSFGPEAEIRFTETGTLFEDEPECEEDEEEEEEEE